jgi:hypothetical protein
MKGMLGIACAFYASGCAAQSALPILALHAAAILHQQTRSAADERRTEYAISMDVSFITNRPHDTRNSALLLQTLPQWDDAAPCLQTWLCDWANASELASLSTFGVAP